jgi:hypothetical protein
MKKIIIEDKYMYVVDEKGNEIAYFEHFLDKDDEYDVMKKNIEGVIKLSIEDEKGESFIIENHSRPLQVAVKCFDREKITKKVTFIRENNKFSLILIN